MSFDSQLHHRRSIRLKGYDYTQVGAYFVTVVTHGRECLFGEISDGAMVLNDLGKIVDECWRAIPEHFANVDLGVHVVMPNHGHGIIVINQDESLSVGAMHCIAPTSPGMRPKGSKPASLGAIIGAFKSAVSHRANKEFGITNIWQRNYYERIIRNEREMDAIWQYIEANPSAWADDAENVQYTVTKF